LEPARLRRRDVTAKNSKRKDREVREEKHTYKPGNNRAADYVVFRFALCTFAVIACC
jgi:hypothetical protein